MVLRVADGDFRDWPAIDAWGTRIAAELTQESSSFGEAVAA
jgi:hypothetical protein